MTAVKKAIFFAGALALVVALGSSMGISASSLALSLQRLALPKESQTHLAQHSTGSLIDKAKRAVADSADRDAKMASVPATDDGLVAEITQDTTQDGTTTRSDGNTKYLEPNIITKKYLKVTAKTDDITVREIEINRGNCSVLNYDAPLKPSHLRFGQSLYFWITCDPIETKVGTDHGLYTFSW